MKKEIMSNEEIEDFVKNLDIFLRELDDHFIYRQETNLKFIYNEEDIDVKNYWTDKDVKKYILMTAFNMHCEIEIYPENIRYTTESDLKNKKYRKLRKRCKATFDKRRCMKNILIESLIHEYFHMHQYIPYSRGIYSLHTHVYAELPVKIETLKFILKHYPTLRRVYDYEPYQDPYLEAFHRFRKAYTNGQAEYILYSDDPKIIKERCKIFEKYYADEAGCYIKYKPGSAELWVADLLLAVAPNACVYYADKIYRNEISIDTGIIEKIINVIDVPSLKELEKMTFDILSKNHIETIHILRECIRITPNIIIPTSDEKLIDIRRDWKYVMYFNYDED